ncbi:hypothetical protein D9M69_458070 [compost metagenome]
MLDVHAGSDHQATHRHEQFRVILGPLCQFVRFRQVGFVLVGPALFLVDELDQQRQVAHRGLVLGVEFLAHDIGQAGARQAGVELVQLNETGTPGKGFCRHPAAVRVTGINGVEHRVADVLLALVVVPDFPAVRAGIARCRRIRTPVDFMGLGVLLDVEPLDVREVQHMSLAAGVADDRQHPAIGLGQARLGLARALDRWRTTHQHFRAGVTFATLFEQGDRITLPLHVVAGVVWFLDHRQADRRSGFDVARGVGRHQLEEPARKGLMVPAVAGGATDVDRHQLRHFRVRRDTELELFVVEVLAVLLLGKQDHDRTRQVMNELEQVADQEPRPADLRRLHQVNFTDPRIIQGSGNAEKVRRVLEVVEPVQHAAL